MSKSLISFVCNVCEQHYLSLDETVACATQPMQLDAPPFVVGEAVYLVPRYARCKERPFVQRTIISAFAYKHGTGYELGSMVQTGKDMDVGYRELSSWSHQEGLRPALKADMHRLGDTVTVWNDWHNGASITVSKETIDENG